MSTWILPLMILIAAVAVAWPLSWYMQFVFDPNHKSPFMRRWHRGLELVLGQSEANQSVTWQSTGGRCSCLTTACSCWCLWFCRFKITCRSIRMASQALSQRWRSIRPSHSLPIPTSIRDKLAAQCRRGQWTGGYPVLGYDVDRSERTPKLVVNSEEAIQVRRIFSLYLEFKNLMPVVEELDKRGWKNKLWHSKKGLPKGGREFDKGSVHALLTNPIYCGKIKHKTDLYPGQHQAIIDDETFQRVQAQLRDNSFNCSLYQAGS